MVREQDISYISNIFVGGAAHLSLLQVYNAKP